MDAAYFLGLLARCRASAEVMPLRSVSGRQRCPACHRELAHDQCGFAWRAVATVLLLIGGAAAAAAPLGPDGANAPSSSQQDRAILQQHLEAVDKWKSAIDLYVDAVPASLADLPALADSLPNPQAVFEYVRDRIALEPYPGAMKGAVGTLVTSGGNDLDRSLLLAAVLSMQGVDAQIAHGQLTAAQAQNLLQQIATKPDAAELMARSLPAKTLPSTPQARQIEALSGARHQRLAESVEQNYSLLDSSLKSAQVVVGKDRTASEIKALQDHYWVRAVIDGKTMDLDTSLAGAEFGKKLADVAETFKASDIDSAKLQQMTLRLIADYLQGGTMSSRTLISSDFNAIDLWGKNIRLAVLPTESKPAANDFHATLSLAGDVAAEQSFQLRIARSAPQSLPQGNNGLFGGLVGAMSGSDDKEVGAVPVGAVLARLYLELETRGPGLSPSRARRIILNRLAPKLPNAQIDPSMARDDVVRRLLTQVWDGAIGVGPVHPLFLARATLAWIGAIQAVHSSLIDAANSGEQLNPADLPEPVLAPELLTFFLASGEAEHEIQTQFAPQLRAYYERPRLALFRHGFLVNDWANLSSPASYREGIDILNSPFGFVGRPEFQSRLAIRWGAADTALELRFSETGRARFNTLPLIAAASSQKVPLRMLVPDQKAVLDSISVPAPIKAALEQDLSDNRAVLAPASLVSLYGTHTYGWWSVDRETGYAIGKMEQGGAQDLSEYTQLQQTIPQWSKTVGNLFANVLHCYMGSVTNVLATGAGASTGGCLQAAGCAALSSVLGMEAGSGMSLALVMQEEEQLSLLRQYFEAVGKYDLGEAAQGSGNAAGSAACGGP